MQEVLCLLTFHIVTLQIAVTPLQLLGLFLSVIWKEKGCLSPFFSFFFLPSLTLKLVLGLLGRNKKKRKENSLVSSMAEDKQAEPKGRSVEGAAFFSLLLPADAQENLFWWSDFLREASGLIATIHWLETLYLWRFEPTASPAVTQLSARNGLWHKEKKTQCYKIREATLCFIWRKNNSSSVNGPFAKSFFFLPI